MNSFGRLPLSFEANKGQIDPRVKFLSRGSDYTLFLTRRGEAVLALRKSSPKRDPLHRRPNMPTAKPDLETPTPSTVVRMSLVGASTTPQLEGLEELSGKANYFIGNDPKKWRTNVPTFAKVRYRSIYPGVDLVYYGNQRQLEHDFIVAPGADPSSITVGLEGAEKLSLDTKGNLVLAIKDGEVRLQKPVVYQEVDGVRREISGAYVLKDVHQAGFQVAAYDARKPLIIDPVLFYSTYLGGSGDEQGGGIAVDTSGNAYVAGSTTSTNFPTTSGALQTTFSGSGDAFVTKLNPTGSGLVYSTYLGGSGSVANGVIAVDSTGNAYIAGTDYFGGFPTTPGAFQSTFGGGSSDAFVAKLNSTGNVLIYSTYLGGNSDDFAKGIAVDATGNAYVTGDEFSSNFPTTPGAYQTSFGGGISDAYVSKLNPTGTSLVYSTYLGGSGRDIGHGIAVDALGNAYVAGETDSSNFPTTAGAYQTTFGGGVFPGDAFVTKVNPTGTGLVYSTYLGGSGADGGHAIGIDPADNAYITGQTISTNFPTTPGAFQTTFGGGSSDAFVAKLNPLGNGLVYATYLGGSGNDSGNGITVDTSFNTYATGNTSSTNFPTVNAIQPALGGGNDAFVTAVNPLGTGLVYSSYLGGSGDDFGAGIALDSLPNPNAYVTGSTGSTNFPTTSGAFQTTFGGGTSDAFVTKIANITLPPGPTVGKVTGGGTVNVSGGIANFGFIVQAQSSTGPISGDLQYVNHASGAKVHSMTFTTFTISGNTATFSGACTNNGAPCTFNVTVQDNDQSPGPDSFVISIDGGPPDGGPLRDGDIEIHNQ